MVFLRQDTSPLHFFPLSSNMLVNGLWQIQGHLKNAFLDLQGWGEGHGHCIGALDSLPVHRCFINVNISVGGQLVLI